MTNEPSEAGPGAGDGRWAKRSRRGRSGDTATSTTRRRDRREKAPDPTPAGFAARAPTGRVRVPETALGLLIVAGFGLGSLWWFTSVSERTEVLALAGPVSRGDVVGVEDLVVVSIDTDDVVATIGRSGADAVLDRVALTDLVAGTVLTPAMFAADDTLRPGEAVVGLELDAGGIPALRLGVGNTVSVILTPVPGSLGQTVFGVDSGGDGDDGDDDDDGDDGDDDDDGDDGDDGGAFRAGEVLVETAVVIETAPVGAQGRWYVALSMTEPQARVVAVAASQDRVRLIQVAREN